MKNLQPNFETIKTAFYNRFIRDHTVNTLLAMQTIKGDYRPFHKRKSEFEKDMNAFLDSIDIRQVGKMIEVCKQYEAKLPQWIEEYDFFIDYNKNGALDVIRNNK